MIHTHTLLNGIRLLHIPAISEVTYCGFAINAGTRDELENEQGMAHFVEHMLFKGTEHRRSWHIINRLESVGGQLDAYTTKEETFIYSTIPTRYTERAMELLSDLMFHSIFPEHELQRERDVVLDEIQSYNDSPSELIYDEFEELLFPNEPIGRSILGTEACLRSFSSNAMTDFVKRCYTTENLLFFVYGNSDFNKIIRWSERYFNVVESKRSFERSAPKTSMPKTVTINKDTFQAHCLIGNRTFPLGHPERTALVLLNNILGGPNMSSRLNLSIRERNGLAYTVDSTLTSYTDTGVWSIYFGCDPKNTKRCLNLAKHELEKLCVQKIDDRQLQIAKRQLLGQMLIANQNKENLTLNIARAFLHLNYCATKDELARRIEAVSSEQLQVIANTIFLPEHLTQLIYSA